MLLERERRERVWRAVEEILIIGGRLMDAHAADVNFE